MIDKLLKSLILKELIDRETHQISRARLMQKMMMHYDTSEEFDNLMRDFKDARIINIASIGNVTIYTMYDEEVEEFKKFFEIGAGTYQIKQFLLNCDNYVATRSQILDYKQFTHLNEIMEELERKGIIVSRKLGKETVYQIPEIVAMRLMKKIA